MNKQLLKIGVAIILIASAQTFQAQCLTASHGMYPEDDFIPECVGTAESIAPDCYAGEYSVVGLTGGVSYTFSSSIATDLITLSDEGGTASIVFGTGSVVYAPTTDTFVRFYTHADAACTENTNERARRVQCGTVPVCNSPIATLPYTTGFEAGDGNACLTYQDVNGGTDSGWGVLSGNDLPTDYGDKSMVYTYDADLPGDDWFYTPGLPFTANTSYTLTFKYRSALGILDLLENFEVKYGTTAAASSMTGPALLTYTGLDTSFLDPFADATVTFTPTTTGNYYIGFHATSAPDQGYIQIEDLQVFAPLATHQFDNAEFAYYPNPVKDKLHFSYTENITGVAVYNLLGQKVISEITNTNNGAIDMSGLTPGAYVVKMTAGNDIQTLKIIKE